MAAFIGTFSYGPYRIHTTAATDGEWGDSATTATVVHVEFVDTTAISRGLAEAAEAVRRFEREVDPAIAELELIPEPPPPWIGFRPAKLPARAFMRRPCSTRRRRRTETARRQKAVRPP